MLAGHQEYYKVTVNKLGVLSGSYMECMMFYNFLLDNIDVEEYSPDEIRQMKKEYVEKDLRVADGDMIGIIDSNGEHIYLIKKGNYD